VPSQIDLITPRSAERLGDRLLTEMGSGRWTDLRAAIAYVKMSGVKQIGAALFGFSASGSVRMTVGIDQQGSSLEGVQTLWQVLGGNPATLFVLNNPSTNPSPTFHPKVWLFSNPDQALLIAGSGNLTAGGLFTNYEFGSVTELDLRNPTDRSVFDRTTSLLDEWADASHPEVTEISAASLQNMHASGELPSESAISSAAAVARAARATIAGVKRGAKATSGLFAGRTVNPAPAPPAMPPLPPPPVKPTKPVRLPGRNAPAPSTTGTTPPAVTPLYNTLYIVVNPRNKTEIFLAKELLKQDPAFFGWPFLGLTTPKRPGNPGQPQPDPLPSASVTVYNVNGSVAGTTIDPSLKLWTYSNGKSANDDFRLTLVDGLHKKVPDGSVLVMTRQPPSGHDYDIKVYPPGHANYAAALAACTQALPGGRRFGWT
jgi:hypothetical protein